MGAPLLKTRTRLAALATLGAFLCGCASSSDDSGGGCNPLLGAGIGAVIGALVGQGNDRVKVGAAGAAVGALACVAYNYYSKRVKSSEQVSNEYAAQKGAVPAQATISKFETQVVPASSVKAGSTVKVQSYIEVVAGTQQSSPAVEQEVSVYAPDGRLVRSAKKPANQGAGGGGFQTSFEVAMPQGVPQGSYTVKSELYLDGHAEAKADTQFQIVADAPHPSVQMSLR